MSDRRRLSMTRDKAAAFRQLLGSVAQQAGSMATQPRGLGRLLVEPTAQMPAAATVPVQCKILTINGTTITDTGCRIAVLNVGPRAIASGTKCYAEPCGRLGYCVSRPAQGTPELSGQLWRHLRHKQVLEPGIRAAENCEWAWATFSSQGASSNIRTADGQYGYVIQFDDAINTGQTTRTYRPNGMRYKIDGWGDMHHGVRGRQESPIMAPGWLGAPPYDKARQTTSLDIDPPVFKSQPWNGTNAPIAFPLTDKTPPSGTHLPYWDSSGLYLSRSGAGGTEPYVWMESLWGAGSYTINIRGWPQLLWTSPVSHVITHGRLWLDGTDVTGIVAISDGYIAGNQNSNIWWGVEWPSLVTDNAKTIEADLWAKVVIDVQNASTPGPIDQIAWLDVRPGAQYALIGQHSNPSGLDHYKLTFDTNGPGGATSLNTVGQSGWDVFRGGYIRIAPSGTSYTSAVYLYPNQESPFVVVFKYNAATSPGRSYAYYLPEDTSDYQPLILPSGASMTAGKWDATTATVFRRVGGNVGTTTGGWTDIHGAGSPTSWDGLYDSFPSTVTVEPYTP